MAKTGSKIEGFWVWFQGGWADTARRFDSKEDALEWTPNLKGKGYLGKRVVMRVAYAPAKAQVLDENGNPRITPWSRDTPEFFDGPETESQAYDRMAKELAKK